MRPLHRPAVAAGASALAALWIVCGVGTAAILAGGAFGLGLALRGRFQVSGRAQLAHMAILLALVWVVGEGLYMGTQTYVSSLSFRLALGLTMALGLGSMYRYDDTSERGYLSVAVTGLMVALVSYTAPAPYLMACVALQAFSIAALLRQQLRASAPSGLAYTLLIPILLVAGGLSVVLQWSETKVNLIFSLITPPPGMSFSFPSTSKLSTLSRSQANPAVVLRYFSKEPSSYLVARCYSKYSEGAWRVPEEQVSVSGVSLPQGGASRFQIYKGPTPTVEDRIELAGPGGDRLIPRDSQTILINASSLQRSLGDCFRLPPGPEIRDYQVERLPGDYPKEFGPDPRQALLDVSPTLRPTLRRLGDEWCPKATSPLQRCKALESYFQDHFQYGFGYPFSDKQEPILSFLQDRPAAHCELFASSLALMLRCYDIPTRYINGFVVKDRDRWTYCIVRGRHAHAWVEAFIEGYGWILLDPTPPSYTAPEDDFANSFQGFSDAFFYYWSRLTSMSWRELLDGGASLLRRLALPLGVLLVLTWIWRSRAAFTWKRQVRPTAAAITLEAVGKVLDEVEDQLKGIGLTRAQCQTLLVWAAQLEAQGATPGAQFLRHYCAVRYGQPEAGSEDLQQLAVRRDEVRGWVEQQRAQKRG